MSKAVTVDYLKSHFDEDLQLHKIYRYLDKLGNRQQELIQQISVEHTRKILGGNIGLVFYDVTTLYFESDYSDGFRETGFSKDGKYSTSSSENIDHQIIWCFGLLLRNLRNVIDVTNKMQQYEAE